ncbi:helix-turn-helix transcriptional regulator [Kaistella faecalis]|uniref:helix-turn-helix transcriptional regulator n=1 Tax=Kaistella faecalis TaxID=2852098 RepID=UPI001C43F25C|nr:WYL domain-containing protein [Chryseobacterium faecale]UFK98273.1 WYL domain-containing protein [Chryseobacterium faecale]
MAKEEQMLRMQYIQEYLRGRKDKGASYRETKAYLERKFEEKDLGELKFTERTFQRDKKAILKVAGIQISYRRSRDVYYIAEEELTNAEESVFDNLLLVEAYREAKSNSDIMIFEPRKSRGLNLLNGIIHAIQNSKVISFTYEKYWTSDKSERVVEPYALKEFHHRWYLLANEFKSENLFIKTFALDRISDFEIKNSSFKKEQFDPRTAFSQSFGIIAPNGEKPSDIILSFDREQGNYIKSLPLHHSQRVVKEENGRTLFSYYLVPTYDFRQEILSHGQRVEVLSPPTLRAEIERDLRAAAQQYGRGV